MSVVLTQVHDIFNGLETGGEVSSFSHLADDAGWIVEGNHPLAAPLRRESNFRNEQDIKSYGIK